MIINKKILTIVLIILILLLGASFSFYFVGKECHKNVNIFMAERMTKICSLYKYLINSDPESQIPESQGMQIPVEQKKELLNSNPQDIIVEEQNQGNEEQKNNNGGLIVCVDQCGDGVCQNSYTTCEDGSLNCICFEDGLDCPKDCP